MKTSIFVNWLAKCTFFVLILSTLCACSSGEKATDSLVSADYESGVSKYEEVVEIDPGDPDRLETQEQMAYDSPEQVFPEYIYGDVVGELGKPFTVESPSATGGTLTYTIMPPTIIDNETVVDQYMQEFCDPSKPIPENSSFVLFEGAVQYDACMEYLDETAELTMNSIQIYSKHVLEEDAEIVELCYFDNHEEIDRSLIASNYFHYHLNSGDILEFHVGAYVPNEWLESGAFYLYVNALHVETDEGITVGPEILVEIG